MNKKNYIFRCASNYLWEYSTCKICPSGWLSDETSCYYFSTDEKTYQKSATACTDKGYGATLTMPLSFDEVYYLNNKVGSTKYYYVSAKLF